jgi:hypothetical protein
MCNGVDKLGVSEFNRIFKRANPKMSTLNQLLQIQPAQAAIWASLGITAPLPTFSNDDHWYGRLSDVIHGPDLRELYIADDDTPAKEFFSNLITKEILPHDSKVCEYNEFHAASADHIRAETARKAGKKAALRISC